MPQPSISKQFWNRAARQNAAWYIATRFTSESPEFFDSGAAEVDAFLRFAGLRLDKDDTLVEIGSGAGRMTRRLAELAGAVIATDVSAEMLARARTNLGENPAVSYVEVSGAGDLPLDSGSASAVFSYITMQHVPTAEAQELYLRESIRVLEPRGWALIQYRRGGLVPRILDWVGHFAHLRRGRNTLSRAWRGARLSTRAIRALAGPSVSIEIRPFGRRHIWVIAKKLS
jgi:SAM-dependent methyltransferase